MKYCAHERVIGETLEKHWAGKEWECLEGSLVLFGTLEEARAAWVAMASTRAK